MIFLNSVSSVVALVFYLRLCTHTDTEGEPKKARVQNIFENLLKNTLFNEHLVVPVNLASSLRVLVKSEQSVK